MSKAEKEVNKVFKWFGEHKTFTTVLIAVGVTLVAVAGWAVAC